MDSTSVSLLERIRTDDDVAWSRFVDIYSPPVFYWCRRMGNLSPEDAADVMQNVFRSVATSVGTFRRVKRGEFRGWLRVITQNKVRDLYRRQSKQTRSSGGSTMQRRLAEFPDQTDDVTQASSEQALITRRALELMKTDFEETSWNAFWQSTIEGRTADDISKELGISRQAVWQACYRVRKRLREELDGMLE